MATLAEQVTDLRVGVVVERDSRAWHNWAFVHSAARGSACPLPFQARHRGAFLGRESNVHTGFPGLPPRGISLVFGRNEAVHNVVE